MLPLPTLARNLGIDPAHLIPHGHDKAKVALEALDAARARRPRPGRLILVSAITPTPAGEGKTVTSIGLAQGLRALGRSAALALRQPSMGPVFGRKGGATGGGLSTLQPAADINLHFTGDFHAVTAAHNLLAAVIDNALHHGRTRLAPGGVLWKRVLDTNDRALRTVRLAPGAADGRESGFDITAASEIMAILCLAASRDDLRARLERLVVGFTAEGEPVRAAEFRVTGALMALLRDALLPNLVQSAEGVPAFVHGGPFANIAHGCNSVLATRMALAHADYAVTEAGFAFDLGGEKFIDIKCRQSGLAPDAIVIVATLRALKLHGGAARDALAAPAPDALRRGLENLRAHLDAAATFRRPVVVALNHFPADTDAELALVHDFCAAGPRPVPCALSQAFARGGAGATALAAAVLSRLDDGAAPAPAPCPPLDYVYPDELPVAGKIDAIARRIYGADGADILPGAAARLALFERAGYGRLPVCMAKTQDSLTDDPKRPGRPRGFRITVRDFELAAGAGFIVALTGGMLRMPALPRTPAAEKIDLAPDGAITGITGT
ncbi:MAG: formate--tetrahydrofolate ligase [Opitutaceae bacterium]|jgi:formate--tetrahydrofolate ligase|nr:formate--tetrahydrofolate ligase [Opitutaceae bacterium]